MTRYFTLLLLLLVTVSTTHAQNLSADLNGKWWWAWRESTHEVVAFNANGQVNVVATVDSMNRFARVTSSIGFAVLESGGEYALYKLTPQSAVQIGDRFEGPVEVKGSQGEFYAKKATLHLLSAHWPYAAFAGPLTRGKDLWVIDLRNDQLQIVAGVSIDDGIYFSKDGRYLRYFASPSSADPDVKDELRERDLITGIERSLFTGPLTRTEKLRVADLSNDPPQIVEKELSDDNVYFSEDGRYLRYFALPSSADPDFRYELRERDLTTGIERSIYTAKGQSQDIPTRTFCHPDQNREQSVCETYSNLEDYSLQARSLLNIDGQVRTIMTKTLSPIIQQDIFFFRDTLIILDRSCESNCFLYFYSPDQSSIQSIPLPTDGPKATDINFVVKVSDTNFLLYTDSSVDYTLTTSGKLQKLGNGYCCEYYDPVSPDFHWAIRAADTDQGYAYATTIWNLKANRVLFATPDAFWPIPDYFDDGFAILDVANSADENSVYWIYFNNTASLIEIPVNYYGRFSDILPGRTLLYEQRQDSLDHRLPTGIYRYDPALQSYTLLVPDATFQFGE